MLTPILSTAPHNGQNTPQGIVTRMRDDMTRDITLNRGINTSSYCHRLTADHERRSMHRVTQ